MFRHHPALAAAAGGSGDRVIDRRGFIVGGIAAVATPRAGESQQGARVYRVGILSPGSPPLGPLNAFRDGGEPIDRAAARDKEESPMNGALAGPFRLPAIVPTVGIIPTQCLNLTERAKGH